MKKISLRPATIILLLIILFLLLVSNIPALQTAFGSFFWDPVVVGTYIAWRLYLVRPLMIAILVFVLAGYVFSRPRWWRFALNRASVGMIDNVVNIPGLEKNYNKVHRWLASWLPGLWREVNQRLPVFLQAAEFKAGLFPRGFMRPNRRYLAVLRARLDSVYDEWQELLSSSISQKVPFADWYSFNNKAQQVRSAWNAHQCLDRAEQWAVFEPVVSACMLGIEQWTLVNASLHTDTNSSGSARPDPDQFPAAALIQESKQNLEMIANYTEYQTGFSQACQSVLAAAVNLDGNVDTLGLVLACIADLIASTNSVSSANARIWARALAQRIITLVIGRLIEHAYFQESIQVGYLSDRLRPDEAEEKNYLSEAGWAVKLVQPTSESWRLFLLSLSWGAINQSLEEFHLETTSTHTETSKEVSGAVELDQQARFEAIQKGYVSYTHDESERASQASQNG